MPEWLRRKKGTPAQVGKPFPVEPHGDKRNLPKALQQVSLSDITDYWEKRKRERTTEDELAEESLIEQAIQDEVDEKAKAEQQKNLLQKLGDALDKAQKRDRLKKALAEAKAEDEANESESGDGYGEYQENLKKKIESRESSNEVFG